MDTVSFVLAGVKPFNAVSAGLTLRILNHDAINNLRVGAATKKDIDILIGAFNILEALMVLGMGKDWSGEILDGQDALLALAQRGASTQHFIARGPELKALNLAMDIHDAQLDHCTVKDVEKAIDMVQENLRHRRARPVMPRLNTP
jgi:hypothetical protein